MSGCSFHAKIELFCYEKVAWTGHKDQGWYIMERFFVLFLFIITKGHPLPWSPLTSSLIFPRDSQSLIPLPTLKALGNGLQTRVAFYAWRWSFFHIHPTKPLWGSYCYPHLPDKETEAEAGQL